MPRTIERLKLTDFLSFGPESEAIELGSLNVLIGPNASGKSNLLEAIAVLQATPGDLAQAVANGGGMHDYLWKGEGGSGRAVIEVHTRRFVYRLGLEAFVERYFRVAEETVTTRPDDGPNACEGETLYAYSGLGTGQLRTREQNEELQDIEVDPVQSILSQRKDPSGFKAITYLGALFSSVRLHRDWSFGHGAPPRLPQRAETKADWLSEDAGNLVLVLDAICRDTTVHETVVSYLQRLHPTFQQFEQSIVGGYVQLFLRETGLREVLSAARLSDGTLRFLALLAILCNPRPTSLICIEEPELGLHPDMMHVLAELLREASERTQLIVTTHSDLLVSAFSDTPEAVIVCEKDDRGTQTQRLDADDLKAWLEKYSLGALWLKGVIGGTRW